MAAKKRKIVQENRVFNEDWTTKYFFVERKRKAVCVICSENGCCSSMRSTSKFLF